MRSVRSDPGHSLSGGDARPYLLRDCPADRPVDYHVDRHVVHQAGLMVSGRVARLDLLCLCETRAR